MTHPTPTGVLVYDGPPVTEEWFKVRRDGITGTDLPKILGISKYGNALSVWRDKRDESPDEEAMEAAQWGNILEEPVAQEWARRHASRVRPVGVLAHQDTPWMRASLDRLVLGCPDVEPDPDDVRFFPEPICGLEVKTRSAYKAREYRDEIPDDVLAQVLWGRRVTGLDHMHVAVLLGGQRMVSFRVDRDDTVEDYLVAEAEKVWASVQQGNPPEVEPDAEGVLIQTLNEIFRSREGDVELGGEAQNLIDDYRDGAAAERSSRRVKEKAKAALIQMLGGGETGLINGDVVLTYRAPEPSDQVTADDLRDMKATNPELYEALRMEGLITRSNPGPRFNLKRATTTREEGA